MEAGADVKPPIKPSENQTPDLTLPTEVTERTPMGRFAHTVLSLIERQTGLPVTDRSKLFDFSTQVEPYGIPLVGSDQGSGWVVSGFRDISHKGKLKGVPMTHIEVAHVVDYEGGRTVSDETLTVDFIGDLDGENRGLVDYERRRRTPQGDLGEDSGIRVGDSEYWDSSGKPLVSMYGNPPGAERGRASLMAESAIDKAKRARTEATMQDRRPGFVHRVAASDLLSRVRDRRVASQIPQAIEHFIGRLPSERDFTAAPIGSTTRDAAVGIAMTKGAPTLKSIAAQK